MDDALALLHATQVLASLLLPACWWFCMEAKWGRGGAAAANGVKVWCGGALRALQNVVQSITIAWPDCMPWSWAQRGMNCRQPNGGRKCTIQDIHAAWDRRNLEVSAALYQVSQ